MKSLIHFKYIIVFIAVLFAGFVSTESVFADPGDPCTTSIYCCCDQGGSCTSPRFRCGSQTATGTEQADGSCGNVSGCNWSSVPCVLTGACGGPPSCSCTPTCTAPSGLTWVNPAQSSQIIVGSVLDWSIGSWGLDSNQSACSGNSCQYQSYSGTGSYQLIVGGVNESSRCAEATGVGTNAILLSSQCTLNSINPVWPNNSITFTVRAANGDSTCSAPTSSRTFSFPPNEKPYCSTLSVTGGRMANGLMGVERYQNITITANTGETDPYGSPDRVNVCYALRGQSQTFYRQGLASWECFTAQNGADFNYTTTLDSMILNYNPTTATAPSNLTQAIDQHGFVLAVNTYDNINTNLFCSNNVGYNDGNGIYWPDQSGCNGGTCTFEIFNNSPSIDTVAPTGTTYVGTEIDTDNGLTCSDNNPMTYTMQVSDADGSSDIDYLQFDLASNSVLINPDPSYAGMSRWELRVQFVKDDYPSPNMFVIRDTNPLTGTQCFRNNRSLEAKEASNMYCFDISDGHNSAVAGLASNVTYSGTSVDIYYLQSDLEVYTGGYQSILRGGSNWTTSSYVAYERSGNRVWANFVVEFEDNGSQRWNGTYNQIWYVRDAIGINGIGAGEDRTDNGALDTIINVDNRNAHHNIGTTIVDLTPPQITLNDPYPISADEMTVEWLASDPDSNISTVYGEASFGQPQPVPNPAVTPFPIYDGTATSDPNTPPYNFADENTWYSLTQDSAVGTDFLWYLRNINAPTATRGEVINIGRNDRGTFDYAAFAEDRACNSSNTTVSESVYLPWIITKGGHVFSAQGTGISITNFAPADYADPISIEFLNYPFNFSKGEVEVSTEWLGVGSLIGTQIINQPRSLVYGSGSYSDRNNQDNFWVADLNRSLNFKIRKDPDSYTQRIINGHLTGRISDECPDSEKYCVISSIAMSVPSGGLICDRKTVIHVTGDLAIDGNITIPSGDKENGCIFLVSGDVDIQDGVHASAGLTYTDPPKYDLLETFILSEGRIRVTEVDLGMQVRDGLKVHGSLVAFGNGGGLRSIQLDRSLKLLDNYNYPTIVVHHDMRYVTIAREIYGGDNETYKREIGFKPL